MSKIFTIISVIFCFLMLLITPFHDEAIADTLNSQSAAQKAEKASERVVQEDSVKEQFGQTQKGEKLIDDAKNTAQTKLNSLAEKTKQGQKLPPQEELFMKNLEGESQG
jgi:hypothetical protein